MALETNRGSPIGLALRLWFVAEVIFGVLAVLSVTLDPANSATRFAWDIKPVVTAAILGAFYASVAPVFVLAALARRWEMVRVIVWPAIVFTSLELLATWLHWPKFLHGQPGFAVWYASYLLPPPIFLVLYFRQQRKAVEGAGIEPMSTPLRSVLFGFGALLAAEGLYSFVNPAHLIEYQAFAITPLTARAAAGWLTALGLMMASMAREGTRDSARIASPFLILPLPLIAIQMARFSGDVDWHHPRLFAMAAVFAISALLGATIAAGFWRRSLR